MLDFKLFHNRHELTTVTCDQPINNIIKIVSQYDHVFLLTTTKQLFYGILDSDSNVSIHFVIIRTDVNNINCSDDSIYVVDQADDVQHLWVLRKTNIAMMYRY